MPTFLVRVRIEWVERARATYRFDLAEQVRAAMKGLGLDRGRVGFDDEGFGRRLGSGARGDRRRLRPADGTLGRVKTPAELEMLARATRLNEKAIRRTMSRWRRAGPGRT